MSEEHPNVSLLKRLNLGDLAGSADTMTLGGMPIEIDAVVVWRIVGGLLAEAWDIPAVNTGRPQTS